MGLGAPEGISNFRRLAESGREIVGDRPGSRSAAAAREPLGRILRRQLNNTEDHIERERRKITVRIDLGQEHPGNCRVTNIDRRHSRIRRVQII